VIDTLSSEEYKQLRQNKQMKALIKYLIIAGILYAIGFWLHVVQNLITGMTASWNLGWYPVAIGCALLLASPILSAIWLALKDHAAKVEAAKPPPIDKK
jgi:cation transport ATPase